MRSIASFRYSAHASQYFRVLAAVALVAALCGFSSRARAQTRPSSGSAGSAINLTSIPGTIAYAQPPSGFDPMSASDTELEQYGFPPRPDPESAPQAYALWHKLVSTPQTRIANPQLQPTNTYHRPVQDLTPQSEITTSQASPYTSSNWSGYTVAASAGTFAVDQAAVYTEYIVPIAQQAAGSCSGSWDYSAQWIGFDGFGSGDVLQAGSEANALCAGGNTSTQYYGVYEWYPNGAVKILNFKVKPGDVMGLEVWYTQASPSGHLYFINYTTQKSVTIGFGQPAGTTFYGNSVEWIVERPTLGSNYATLSHYVAAPFNNTYALANGMYYYPGSSPAGAIYDITMVSGSTPISIAELYGNSTLWFYEVGPAKP